MKSHVAIARRVLQKNRQTELSMLKLISGISLMLCTFTTFDSAFKKPSVSVRCCGRLRDGIVAIGGETTGTTITFNRMVWELQLPDAAARRFAQTHNKEFVNVTGTLRRIAGTEVKERWIIDVKTLSEHDSKRDKVGIQLTIQGTLRATDSRTGDSPILRIEADGQIWPVDVTLDARLKNDAESLIDQPVLLAGTLEQVAEEDSDAPRVIRVKTLKRSSGVPIHDQSH
jgi:hypothetical protein